MNAKTGKRALAKPTGRRYASVEEMMRINAVSDEVQAKYKENTEATRIVSQLAKLRQKAGLTQQQMAKHLGVTQSAVSKLESGRDEDLTIGQIRGYGEALGQRMGVVFGRPMTHVEAVKFHANSMRSRLSKLAELACNAEELEKDIQAFFGEAFFNILNILVEAQSKMPKGNSSGVQFQIMEGNKEAALNDFETTNSQVELATM